MNVEVEASTAKKPFTFFALLIAAEQHRLYV